MESRTSTHSVHHLLMLLLVLSLLILSATARLLSESNLSTSQDSLDVKFTESIKESSTVSSLEGRESHRVLHDVPSGPNPIGNMLPGKYTVQRSPPDPEVLHYDP